MQQWILFFKNDLKSLLHHLVHFLLISLILNLPFQLNPPCSILCHSLLFFFEGFEALGDSNGQGLWVKRLSDLGYKGHRILLLIYSGVSLFLVLELRLIARIILGKFGAELHCFT